MSIPLSRMHAAYSRSVSSAAAVPPGCRVHHHAFEVLLAWGDAVLEVSDHGVGVFLVHLAGDLDLRELEASIGVDLRIFDVDALVAEALGEREHAGLNVRHRIGRGRLVLLLCTCRFGFETGHLLRFAVVRTGAGDERQQEDEREKVGASHDRER